MRHDVPLKHASFSDIESESERFNHKAAKPDMYIKDFDTSGIQHPGEWLQWNHQEPQSENLLEIWDFIGGGVRAAVLIFDEDMLSLEYKDVQHLLSL